jgi:hypothetical protein
VRITKALDWYRSTYANRFNLAKKLSQLDNPEYESEEEFDFFMRSNEITSLCNELCDFERIKMWEEGAMLDCHKDFLNRVNEKIEVLTTEIDKADMYATLKN